MPASSAARIVGDQQHIAVCCQSPIPAINHGLGFGACGVVGSELSGT